MIEFFDVAPQQDEAFLAAWAAGGTGTLHRALRDDARWRYAAVPGAPRDGVLLLGEGFDPAIFAGRQGFLGGWVDSDVAVVHWSSPLMYHRAGPLADPAALYVPVRP